MGKYFINSINGNLIIIIKNIEKYEKLLELLRSQNEFQSNYSIYFKGPIESLNIKYYIDNSINYWEEKIKSSINDINRFIENLINDNIKYDSSYKYLFNEIYEEKDILKALDFEIIDLNLSMISKYE